MNVAQVSVWLAQFEPGEEIKSKDGFLTVNRRDAKPREFFQLNMETGDAERWRLVDAYWKKEP